MENAHTRLQSDSHTYIYAFAPEWLDPRTWYYCVTALSALWWGNLYNVHFYAGTQVQSKFETRNFHLNLWVCEWGPDARSQALAPNDSATEWTLLWLASAFMAFVLQSDINSLVHAHANGIQSHRSWQWQMQSTGQGRS